MKSFLYAAALLTIIPSLSLATEIKLDPYMVPVQYIDIPQSRIQSEAINSNATGIHSHQSKVLGLTKGDFFSQYSTSIVTTEQGNAFQIQIKSINIKYGYKNHNVYVASQFKRGSCEHNFTTNHENKHVNVNLLAYKLFEQNITQEINRNLVGTRLNGHIRERALKEQEIKVKVDNAVRTVNNIIENTLKPMHNRIDTDDKNVITKTCGEKWASLIK